MTWPDVIGVVVMIGFAGLVLVLAYKAGGGR
jgi:hypothetical protein